MSLPLAHAGHWLASLLYVAPVAIIVAALVLAPWGLLPWGMGLLTVAAWSTVLQRILLVRGQLREKAKNP